MLQIRIIAVGKKHDRQLLPAIEAYEQKVRPFCKMSWDIIPSSDIEAEGVQICNRTKAAYVLLLDEAGEHISSEHMADFLDTCQTAARNDIAIVIGGAYGVSSQVKQRADRVIALSKLTFPHQLVRLILVEQLYRGFAILSGSQYHHS